MSDADRALRGLTGYCLHRSYHSVSTRVNALFAEYGLRRTTFSALALIVECPGLRQSQLAEALAIERPNMVQIIDELEQAGLVRREVSSTDRRAYAMQPSDAGRALFKKALAGIQALDRAFTAGMSAEQESALRHALHRIEQNCKLLEKTDDVEISRS